MSTMFGSRVPEDGDCSREVGRGGSRPTSSTGALFGDQHTMSVVAELCHALGAVLYTVRVYGQVREHLNRSPELLGSIFPGWNELSTGWRTICANTGYGP